MTSVSFPSRGPLSSYGSLDASLRPRRHTRSHRSASSTARTAAPRPRSGSRTSPAAGTTSRPRSRATSASPSRTWGCAAGEAGTRPGWRGPGARQWMRLYCPERPTRTTRAARSRRETRVGLRECAESRVSSRQDAARGVAAMDARAAANAPGRAGQLIRGFIRLWTTGCGAGSRTAHPSSCASTVLPGPGLTF